MKKRDSQKELWLITINNPEEHGATHDIIKKTLLEEFSTVQYFAMVDEKGSCYHTHCVIYFNSRVRFSTIKRKACFSKANILEAKGTLRQCVSYLHKDGKWIDDQDKQDQKIEGTFEEWGEMPPEKKSDKKMAELLRLVKEGYSNIEIIEKNPDYILFMDKIERLRINLLIEKYKGTRRLNLRCIYISGPTGTGKSRYVLDTHGDENVYRVTDYQHPFDHYSPNQSVMCFEEFRSQIRISEMLVYMDIYPVQLPARYANSYACFDTLYILSNWELEMQYSEVQQSSPESWNAFLRRIHEVRIFHEDDTVTVYDSVEKYLHRNENFHPADSNTEIPFENNEDKKNRGGKCDA